jgi:hypothetical protein
LLWGLRNRRRSSLEAVIMEGLEVDFRFRVSGVREGGVLSIACLRAGGGVVSTTIESSEGLEALVERRSGVLL